MNKLEKLEAIKDFMTENQIFYEVAPMDQNRMDDYMVRLKEKLPELYKFCRTLDLTPENSYDRFVHVLEHSLNVGVNTAMFRR